MRQATRRKLAAVLGGAAFLAGLFQAADARACGCFAPPDPSVPIVQAGERILFSVQDGEVTAHIQIQYAGGSGEFGWILPLPSVPTLDLGTDELFLQLTNTTQPKYTLNRVYEGNCSFDPSKNGFGGGFAAPQAAAGDTNAGGARTDNPASYNPLVYQDSVGPYDYAVLKADRKQEMIDWLNNNHYFIPVGTNDVVDTYIRPGAFFLALKLKSGNDTGDLQPVVLKYQSDLPMIPIVLTSVAAQDDMGIQVWMLGEGRAIPRNYYHTVINDAKIDWIGAGQNYNDVIIAATHEAPDRHTFVTEYAGSSGVMQKQLNYDGRFGTAAELATQPDEITFVDYLNNHGYAISQGNSGGFGGPGAFNGASVFSTQLVSILTKYIPVPDALTAQGITASQFYQGIDYYLGEYRSSNPQDFANYTTNFQPQMMADEIDMRVIQPTLNAGKLFDQSGYLTRLYTTLSGIDMTADPVFSYNVGLGDVNNTHSGSLTYHCGFNADSPVGVTPATLVTESGWRIYYPDGTGETFSGFIGPPPAGSFSAPQGPYSARIETLAEEGAPTVDTDNTGKIQGQLPSAGCTVAGSAAAPGAQAGFGVLFALTLLGLVLRRRS
jgi:hypothetical protein